MNETFVKNLYKVIIEDGKKTYVELFEKTEITSSTVDYWKEALSFYNNLDSKEREIFKCIINQVMIDTVSGVFGIIDGSSSLDGDFSIDMSINGEKNECELQDLFLEYVEELNN